MLDITLVSRNKCYRFKISKAVRELLFELRRNPERYIPAQIDVSVRKPIVRIFNGGIKTMPICFGMFHTSSDNLGDNVRVAVLLNYYSKMAFNEMISVPDNLYIKTIVGQMNVAAAASTGIANICLIGSEEPTIISIRRNLKAITESIDISMGEVEKYVEQYKESRKYNIRPGLHCSLCERKETCL